jgi:uncharacterized RDD family membrane protein YckC
LTERIRAARAKRNGGKPADQIVEEIRAEEQDSTSSGSSRRDIEFIKGETLRVTESNTGKAFAARMAPEPTLPDSEKEQVPAARPGSRANDQIVEAALLRARRASESASRISTRGDSSSKSSRLAPKSSMVVDKQATAKAIEITVDVKPRTEIKNDLVPKVTPQERTVSAPEKVPPVSLDKKTTRLAETPSSPVSSILVIDDPPSVSPIDDIEPVDYLTAEIKKFDREMKGQFAHNESPVLIAHLILNVVDFLTISLSSTPFLALIEIYGGNFLEHPTQVAGVSVVSLVTFFYLALTQSLCGKTFGMMVTNTRIVDARTFDPPSPQRALVRSAGYFLAFLPGLIGIFWLAFNRRRRGWQDYISGTMVARDF